MTVEATTSRVLYATNGTTGPWTVPFYFLANDHLQVLYTTSAGVETTLVLTTNYSVTGAGDEAGGTVTTVTAYAAGGFITVLRNVPATQLTDYIAQDAFPAESHEQALDKLTMLVQQNKESVERVLRFQSSDPITAAESTLPTKATRLGKLLSFDEVTGLPEMSNFTHTQVASAIAAAYLAGSTADAVAFVPAGTGAVAITVQTKLRYYKDVEDNGGAVGDGSTDDYAAIQIAINTGKSLRFSKTYAVSQALLFNQSNCSYEFINGGGFKYTGNTSNRMYEVSGDNVEFIRPVFDGNNLQPSLALGYIDPGAHGFRMWGGRTKNMVGNSAGTNLLNQMYGLGISTDNVRDFLIDCHVFEDFSKDNSGTHVGPTIGIGFCGGIVVIPKTGTDPTGAYTAKSTGQIVNCGFDNIQTVRAGGLSLANWNDYDDSDGIRLYGNKTYTPDCDITISNCWYRDVSKRAVKSSIKGVKVRGISIETTSASPYPMASLVKLHNDNEVHGVTAVMGSSAYEVSSAIQYYNDNISNNYCCAKNVTVDFCRVLVEVIAETPVASILNAEFNGFKCGNVSIRAVSESAGVATATDTLIDNFDVTARGTNVPFAITSTSGWRFGKIKATNMSFKAVASSFTVDDVTLKITDAAFTGPTGTAPLEIGGGGSWNVNRISLDVTGLGAGVFPTAQPYIALIYGTSRNRLKTLELTTADAASTASRHIEFYGSDCTIGDIVYDGPGTIGLGILAASDRNSFGRIKRIGTTATTAAVFIGTTSTDRNSIGEVHDLRPTNVSSVRLLVNSGATAVGTVISTTSAGSATQDDTGGQLSIGYAVRI